MTPLEQMFVPGALRIEFQPIIAVSEGHAWLYALEALARGPIEGVGILPNALFDFARSEGRECELDRLCIAEALSAARSLPEGPSVSINVHGSTLAENGNFAAEFLDAADDNAIDPQRLILEIVEHRAPWSMEPFRRALQQLRVAGVRIAVDDLGTGASNFRMVVDCQPDHLKVDRYIVRGCSRDSYRMAVLESLVTLAHSSSATLIAEGVETVDDLHAVTSLGIRLIQGFLYARSMPAREVSRSDFLSVARKFAKGSR